MRKHGVPDQPRSSFAMLRVRDIWNLPPSGPPNCLSKSWYANGGKAGLAWKRARAKSFQTKGSAHVSVESWTGSHMESRGTTAWHLLSSVRRATRQTQYAVCNTPYGTWKRAIATLRAVLAQLGMSPAAAQDGRHSKRRFPVSSKCRSSWHRLRLR